jgi:hypothetical protein
VLAAALGLAAFAAGATGTWSPCGFSMIETIGGPQRRVVASCAAFTLGACAGGAASFAALGAAGSLVPSRLATTIALTLAVAGAFAEARNARIAPQIRRQVPERWRRTLPLPVAAALYGLVLGLGFTTFVLTFAFWAVAALTFGAGGLSTGVAVGSRVRPGPRAADRRSRAGSASADRRCGTEDDGGASTASARRAHRRRCGARAGRGRSVRRRGAWRDQPRSGYGSDRERRSSRLGNLVRRRPRPRRRDADSAARPTGARRRARRLAHRRTGARRDGDGPCPCCRSPHSGADALCLSDRWLVTRERAPDGGDSLVARPLAALDQPQVVAATNPPAQLGRPAIDADVVVVHEATRAVSRILAIDLAAGTSRIVRSSRRAQLTNPSLLAGQLLYVRQTSTAQLLEVGPLAGGRDRVLYRLGAPAARDRGYEPGHSSRSRTRTPRPKRAAGTLWTTALSGRAAYVTFVPRKRGAAAASIVAVTR